MFFKPRLLFCASSILIAVTTVNSSVKQHFYTNSLRHLMKQHSRKTSVSDQLPE